MRCRVPVLGHVLIDRQHQRIEQLIRDLDAAVLAEEPVSGLLGQLLRATRRHFTSEDRLMRISGYRDAGGHQALHRRVVEEMARLHAGLSDGLPMHRKHVAQMGEWLEHHASEADRNLVAWLATC